MDIKGILTDKLRKFDRIKANLAEIDSAKNKLLQEGLELQGAIKQLQELLVLTQSPPASTGAEDLPVAKAP